MGPVHPAELCLPALPHLWISEPQNTFLHECEDRRDTPAICSLGHYHWTAGSPHLIRVGKQLACNPAWSSGSSPARCWTSFIMKGPWILQDPHFTKTGGHQNNQSQAPLCSEDSQLFSFLIYIGGSRLPLTWPSPALARGFQVRVSDRKIQTWASTSVADPYPLTNM